MTTIEENRMANEKDPLTTDSETDDDGSDEREFDDLFENASTGMFLSLNFNCKLTLDFTKKLNKLRIDGSGVSCFMLFLFDQI